MQIHPSLRNIEQKWRRLNLTYVQEEEKNLTRLFAGLQTDLRGVRFR